MRKLRSSPTISRLKPEAAAPGLGAGASFLRIKRQTGRPRPRIAFSGLWAGFCVWAALSLLLAGFCASLQAEERIRRVVVGLALSTTGQEHWKYDLEGMRLYAEVNNVELVTEINESGQVLQNQQIERLLSRNPAVLILTPGDSAVSSYAVARARARGVKVIAYNRLPLNCEVDLYIAPDYEKAGRLLAAAAYERAGAGAYVLLAGSPGDYSAALLREGLMAVLGPLAAQGRVKVAADKSVFRGDQNEARRIMRRFLIDNPAPAAVLTTFDTAAAGVIDALAEKNLAGGSVVGGLGGGALAARRVSAGSQSLTIFIDWRQMGRKAVAASRKLAAGETVETRARIWDGRAEVPAVLFEPVVVDYKNLSNILIKSGYVDYHELYGQPERRPR